jgi:XTP/dITP diphosphohydrolase
MLITLYAATSNPGKLAELSLAAQPSGITVEPLPGIATMPEPVEDAPTFQGNADLKAIAYSRLSPNHLVLCDDSGIELPALLDSQGNARPGVRSARLADDLAFDPSQQSGCPTSGTSDLGVAPPLSVITKDARNNAALLSLLTPGMDRTCRFACALALARNGHVLLHALGTVEGQLLTAPRGSAGFGYDPLFFLPSLNLTMAELPREQKWQLSHRGNAFRSLLQQIASEHNRLPL